MPRCRSQSSRASEARSAPRGISRSSTRRKSFPSACAFTTFIRASVRSRHLFGAKRQQVPPVSPDPCPGERVEGADEERVEQRPLPPAVEPRLHREALLHDSHRREAVEKRAELADAVL